MRRAPLALVVVLLAGGPPAAAQDQDRKERERVAGTWRLMSVQMDGKTSQPPAGDKSRVNFTADGNFEMVLDFGGKTDSKKGTFFVRRGQDRGNITLLFREAEMIYLVLGIYSLEGDRLKLCLGNEDASRPTDFAAPAGSDVMVNLVLRRAKK